jgi:hypothetical protein
MSAITSYQPLQSNRASGLETINQPAQRWKLLKPQEELHKNLTKLCAVQIVAIIALAVLSEIGRENSTSIYSDWKFSMETYAVFDQLMIAFYIAAIFTALSSVFTWAYFVKSNREQVRNNADITPSMKIAIRNQIEQAIRRN